MQDSVSDPTVSVYRPVGFWKWVMLLSSGALIAGSVAGIKVAFTQATESPILLPTICILFLLLGAYCFVWTTCAQIILRSDSLEIREIFDKTVVSLGDLRGWRIQPTTPPSLIFEFEGRGGSRKKKTNMLFPLDDRFSEWLSHVPDLDDVEGRASQDDILSDERLGLTGSQREESLNEARQRAKVLDVLAGVLLFWGLLYPHPYKPLMLALIALPWVALEVLRRSHGAMRIDARKTDAHPTVASAAIMPSIILALRAILDVDVLYSWRIAAACAVITILLLGFCIVADAVTARKPVTIILMAIIFAAYGYGSVIAMNGFADRGEAKTYTTTVRGKHVTSGKHTSYNLELAPWGPESGGNDVDVGKNTYEQTAVGQHANIAVHRGLLGIQWFEIVELY